MKHFLTILSHEIRTLLFSSSTYVAAVLFVFVLGFLFAGIIEDYVLAPQEESPAVRFFQTFIIPVFFMVPLLTMKSLAEERRQGTLETLLTTPVSTGEVVLGKFGAAYFLYLLMWAATYGFHVILARSAGDARFLDPGQLAGGYLFIAVSGMLFIALGIFTSAMTRSQAVAGILSFTLLLVVILGFSYLQGLAVLNEEFFSPAKGTIESLQVLHHLEDFTNGVVDTRQVFFYVTGAALALLFSILGVEAKILQS